MELAKLPNVVREHMITRGQVHAAMILDALYLIRATMHRDYTIADMLAMLSPMGISEKVIRSGCKALVFRRGTRKTNGRAAFTYVLPSPRQVLQWYMLYDASEHADTLPVSAFASSKAYREAMHIAMVKRLSDNNGGQFKMARQKMASRLAVCINTIRNYERDSPIVVTQHITHKEIHKGWHWGLPAANTNDHSQWLLIVAPSGETRHYPLVSAIAAQAINAGCRVWHMRQHSNLYSFMVAPPAETEAKIKAGLEPCFDGASPER